MAAVSLIAGSILGWLVASLAWLTGATLITAMLIYLTVSLACAASLMTKAPERSHR